MDSMNKRGAFIIVLSIAVLIASVIAFILASVLLAKIIYDPRFSQYIFWVIAALWLSAFAISGSIGSFFYEGQRHKTLKAIEIAENLLQFGEESHALASTLYAELETVASKSKEIHEDLKQNFYELSRLKQELELQESPKRKREYGPRGDTLPDCQKAMVEWLDKGKSLNVAASLCGRDDQTILKNIPNVLELVDIGTQEKWIKAIKAQNKAKYLGKYGKS